jgi:hypothetical protein
MADRQFTVGMTREEALADLRRVIDEIAGARVHPIQAIERIAFAVLALCGGKGGEHG